METFGSSASLKDLQEKFVSSRRRLRERRCSDVPEGAIEDYRKHNRG
jgi:hypothetical protein